MAAKTRRGRRHPGVVICKPEPGRNIGWRARWKDPDTSATKRETFPSSVKTAEQRVQWAVAKAEEIAMRRLQLKGGAPRTTGTALSKAIDRYFEAHPRLGERTRGDYRAVADKLLEWAQRVGIASADDLTRARLMQFREELIREPKRTAQSGKGVGRGKRKTTGVLRSNERVNTEMRKARTVLGYIVDLDLFPRLTLDDLRRTFKRLDVPKKRIDYLRPHELQQLLEAALRHDAEVFEATRDELAGRRMKGSTPRYTPIAPFTAGVLLTGMRLGEALALEWRSVDLDALDSNGRKVGEVHLEGERLKTKQYRDVDLSVSPSLRSLLAAMQLASRGKGRVFALTEGEAEAAAKRLKTEYGAPAKFGWQALRRTCGTFLTNAPGIFGAASAYRSAKQLGHSVQVAERHYLGLVRGIAPDVRTLEAAMQIEEIVGRVIAQVSPPRSELRLAASGDAA